MLHVLNVHDDGSGLNEKLTSDPGTYILVLKADQHSEIQVGKLGVLAVRPGYYVYIGSAFGPGGLRARLKHHLGCAKRLHWHIDYLRRVTHPEKIYGVVSKERYEHLWVARIGSLSAATMPLTGFGATDSRAKTHLFYFRKKPDLTNVIMPSASS